MKRKILAGMVVLLGIMTIVIPAIGESQKIDVIRTTEQNWINRLNENDNVLIIVHGILSHATDVSNDFAIKLAESRGYNKVVVFEYAPRPKALWFGDPLTSTDGGFNLVKAAAEITSRTGNDVGVFGHSQGTVVINRAAYYIHGSWLPWAPLLTSTEEMKKVRFREVIFAGSTIPFDANLKYLEDVITGETPKGEKALYNTFSPYDIATNAFQTYFEDGLIEFGITALGDRNIEFEPKGSLRLSIPEHLRVGQDADLFKSVPQIRIPQKKEMSSIPGSLPENTPVPSYTTPIPPPWDDGNGGSGGGLGGVDFTDVQLRSVYSNTSISPDGNLNAFSYSLIAKKTKNGDRKINVENATELSLNSFFIGLTIPTPEFWVNLNPWESNKIIEEDLKKTDVGRIMLEADLRMKKDFSKYENPCESKIGEEYWKLLDQKREELVKEIMEKHPNEIKDANNVRFIPVTRHWIVPDKVEAYETDNEISIVNATLNINSEPVYEHSTYEIVNQNSFFISGAVKEDLKEAAKEYGRYVKDLEEKMTLPLVINEINHGINYSDLRGVYISLAFAQWYKNKYRNSPSIFTDFIDSKDLTGLESKSEWSAEGVWKDYKKSFEEGEYNCWKNETYREGDYIITRSGLYSEGGVDFMDIKITTIGVIPQKLKELTSEAVYSIFAKEENDYYFGDSFYVVSESATPVPQKEQETAGFEVVFAIAGLLAVVYLIRQKK